MTAETLRELTDLLRWVDERHKRPPTSPAMKDYSRGFQDALLDMRIELKKKIDVEVPPPAPPTPPSADIPPPGFIQ